jgi:hypothetical protein
MSAAFQMAGGRFIPRRGHPLAADEEIVGRHALDSTRQPSRSWALGWLRQRACRWIARSRI